MIKNHFINNYRLILTHNLQLVVLPRFDTVVLRSFLEPSQTVGETNLMHHVHQWVREQLNN